MSQKITAVMLVMIILLSCVTACGESSEVPNGMQSATCQGASYRLYVPSNWTPNVNSGISGAFFAQGEYSMVTVTDYICEDESETPEVRKAAAEAAYASLYPTYEKLSESDVKLGKEDAKAFVFKFKIEKVTCKCMEIIARHEDSMYTMLFVFTEENYDSFADNRDSIIANFIFAKAYTSDKAHKIPKNVTPPAGMKLCSFDEGSYRLFVPETWILHTENGLTMAYVSDSDASNVSLMVYMPESDSMSLSEYWDMCKKDYEKNLQNFTVLEEVIFDSEKDKEWDLRMGGRVADKVVFTATAGGETYRYCQYFCTYASMIYVLTYTSRDALFSSHMPEVEKILSEVVLGY